MQCSICGTQLPVGAAYCPTCGAVTPYNVANSGISPHAPTAISSPSGLPEHKPATDYGSPPYGVPPQNPYEPLNPYDVPLRAPPPPSPKRHFKIGLFIGAVVLVVALASVSVFALFTQLATNKPSGMTSPSPASTAQISITATPSAITATGTANSVPNPISPFLGMPVLNDPLRDNSEGYNWQEISDNSESCAFAGGAYHAKTLAGGYFYPCTAGNTDFDNFAYEVQMKIMKGDCGAILFRVDRSITNFYYFRVCQDGTYALFVYSNNSGSTLIPAHSNSAINAGLNKPNLIAVVARGSILDLYINKQKIDSINDSAYSHGKIAVVADGIFNHPTEVVYSNAKVWKL